MTASTHPPRLLTKAQAAAYLNLSTHEFDEWVLDGRLPHAIPRSKLWDKIAIDLAIDELSDLNINGRAAPIVSDLARFKADRAARKSSSRFQAPEG